MSSQDVQQKVLSHLKANEALPIAHQERYTKRKVFTKVELKMTNLVNQVLYVGLQFHTSDINNGAG